LTTTAATRVAGVIGDPVRHSLSPVLHNVAYKELGLDWVYVAFEVPDGGARGALDAMRLLDLVGLSVTMPHKTAAAGACDELSTTAAALRSVNTVSVGERSRLVGDSTDGEGFLRALREAGHDPAGRAVALLGAGGAARAVARALGEAHAQVLVCARKPDAA
jgi:shikimate dehydrogenase